MKIITKLVLTTSFVVSLSVASAQDKVITFSQLPATAQNFVKSEFKNQQISMVKEDKELFNRDYEVKFNDGLEIEFDKNGNWKKIDNHKSAVPSKFIPASIIKYVEKSFPGTFVTEIKKDNRKYDIELSNGIDLEFNSKGKFLRIDQ